MNPDTLYHEIISNRDANKPVMAQEVLWYGNMYQSKNGYTDEQLRQNTYIINMAAAALNFGDNRGNSSSGFSGNLNLNERHQDKHNIIKKVWDFFESVPFYELKPSSDISDHGYTLYKPGEIYLTYLPDGGNVNIKTENSGMYTGEWINARRCRSGE